MFETTTDLYLFRKHCAVRPRNLNRVKSRCEIKLGCIAGAAHSLKSTSCYVRANSLSELGAEMERLADAGQLEEIAGLIDLAEKEFSALGNHLQPVRSTP